jgi:hypothetical protein
MTKPQDKYIVTETEWQLLYAAVPTEEEAILHKIRSRTLSKHDAAIRGKVLDEVQLRLMDEMIEIGYHEQGDMWAPLKGTNEAFAELRRGEQP